MFPTKSDHVPGCATFNLNNGFLSEAHILEFVPNNVCDGRQCYTKTDAKETVQSDILLFFPGTAIAGRHCTPAILLHPSEGIQFNPIQSKRLCLHIFVELLLVKKTKHLVDLTPFKQPLRSFLATELKPQYQTPRSLGHH